MPEWLPQDSESPQKHTWSGSVSLSVNMVFWQPESTSQGAERINHQLSGASSIHSIDVPVPTSVLHLRAPCSYTVLPRRHQGTLHQLCGASSI